MFDMLCSETCRELCESFADRLVSRFDLVELVSTFRGAVEVCVCVCVRVRVCVCVCVYV